jgi:hypothetical protein
MRSRELEASVKIRTLVLVGIIAALFAATAGAADKPEDLAQAAAESWLKLTDGGDAGASWEYAEKLPGAPEGKYVVIQYETVFENRASAVETVTPMLDPDGVWRVSGYFIR